MVGAAADPLAWTGFSHCAELVTATATFTGTVSGTLLDASFAKDAMVRCAGRDVVTVNVHLRGTR